MYLSIVLLLGAAYISEAAEPLPPTLNQICKHRNGYYAVDSSCDAYIECKDFIARTMMCPDGLHYNPLAAWPDYPCGYPMDVQCQGRGTPQQPQPTSECPHQYGFYPSLIADANDCGQYRMCVEGKAIEMLCPTGLAFNPDNAHCDWPDLVPSCNADAYLGFKCPPVPLDEQGLPLDIVQNFKYEGHCYAFFSCEHGKARLLTCDPGFAFDPLSGRCEDAEKVVCNDEVKTPGAMVGM